MQLNYNNSFKLNRIFILKMEYKKNIKNGMMKRQEISFIVKSEKNPGFGEMRKKISEEMNKPEENIEVYGIQGKFGRDTFLIKANVYDTKKDLDEIKILSKTKKQRKNEAEEAKKAIEDAKKAGEEAKKAEEEEKKSKEEESKTEETKAE